MCIIGLSASKPFGSSSHGRGHCSIAAGNRKVAVWLTLQAREAFIAQPESARISSTLVRIASSRVAYSKFFAKFAGALRRRSVVRDTKALPPKVLRAEFRHCSGGLGWNAVWAGSCARPCGLGLRWHPADARTTTSTLSTTVGPYLEILSGKASKPVRRMTYECGSGLRRLSRRTYCGPASAEMTRVTNHRSISVWGGTFCLGEPTAANIARCEY